MYDSEDRRAAELLEEWLKKHHTKPGMHVEDLLDRVPRPIQACIRRLTFLHSHIVASDLMEMCKRVKEERADAGPS